MSIFNTPTSKIQERLGTYGQIGEGEIQKKNTLKQTDAVLIVTPHKQTGDPALLTISNSKTVFIKSDPPRFHCKY